MRRIANYDRHVIRTAERLKGREFEWGETDCANVTQTVVNAMYLEPVLNVHISSLRDAREVFGATPPSEILLGAEAKEIAPGLATCGDVLVGPHDREGLASLYVVLRGGIVIGSHPDYGVLYIKKKELKTYSSYRMPV